MYRYTEDAHTEQQQQNPDPKIEENKIKRGSK